MKNYIYILFLLLLSSCNKSEEYLFDQSPDERMEERLTAVKNQLLSAENGWVVYNQTLSKGLYGYYMEFDENERVRMVADINSSTANTMKESIYSLRVVSTPVLSFETYNYINLLNDPNASVVGGVRGDGLKSDIEFELVRNNVDSIIFKGRRYNTEFVLVRATALEKEFYLSKQYDLVINKTKDFFVNTKIPYIEVKNVKYQIELNPTTKKTMITSNIDGKAYPNSNEYYYNSVGVYIPKGVKVGDIKIIAYKWVNNELMAESNLGDLYSIKDSPDPILPLNLMLAFNGTFKELYIGANLPDGVNSTFNAAYFLSVNAFKAMSPSRQLLDVKFRLVNNKTATVTTRNNNGTSVFTAVATFNYTFENDIIILSDPVYDNNWTARAIQHKGLQDFFSVGSYRVDYVSSSNPNVKNLGGLYKVSDPTSFFYGVLQ